MFVQPLVNLGTKLKVLFCQMGFANASVELKDLSSGKIKILFIMPVLAENALISGTLNHLAARCQPSHLAKGCWSGTNVVLSSKDQVD
ncbi:MAG: hypothetical protein R3B74_05035 [Nitrospirales bacterium]|nr:hypothetical protein [Nitrospirales bacterium]